MYSVDIHKYKESVNNAIYELEVAISIGRKDKDHLVKVITGYGSSGGTHKIKTAVIEYLESKKNHGIKDFIIGSDLFNYNEKFYSFKYHHRIPKEEKMHQNPGVIYVIL